MQDFTHTQSLFLAQSLKTELPKERKHDYKNYVCFRASRR